MQNLKIYSADVSNAFVEDPPPRAILYVTVDKQYRKWWHSKHETPFLMALFSRYRKLLRETQNQLGSGENLSCPSS